MATTTQRKPRKKVKKIVPRSGAAKYPGITGDARELGVTRQHLYLVLEGQRTSVTLMDRYLELKKLQRRSN